MSNSLYQSVTYRMDYPPDYVNHMKTNTRAIFGENLVKYLVETNKICTCKITEEDYRIDYDSRLYTISANLSVVQTHNIVMAVMPDYGAMNWKVLSGSAIDEIKSRVRRSVKKILARFK